MKHSKICEVFKMVADLMLFFAIAIALAIIVQFLLIFIVWVAVSW